MRNPLLRKKSVSPVQRGGLGALCQTVLEMLDFRRNIAGRPPQEHQELYGSARHRLRELYRGILAALPRHARRLIAEARYASWDLRSADESALHGSYSLAVQSQHSAALKMGGILSALRRGKVAYGYDICLTADTKVPLLDGTTVELASLVGKDHFWVYSLTENGKLRPGYAHSARLIARDAPLLAVELDSGEIVRCTLPERFMARMGGYKHACDLGPGDSLMPFYRDSVPILPDGNEYERVYQPGTDSWEFTHRFAEARCPKGYVRHHKDLNRFNNSPENLELMLWGDHLRLHQQLGGTIVTNKARAARRQNMMKINSDRRGKPRPWAHFPHPWVDKQAVANILSQCRTSDHQRRANQAANHKRWHIDRGIVNPGCQLCTMVNHKVVSVKLAGTADVYDFIVEKYHNFALLAGVFVHNSGEIGEVWHGTEDIANRENQKNIDDTAQPFEQHETKPNPANVTRDYDAERDYPSLAERKSKRVHWPPRLR